MPRFTPKRFEQILAQMIARMVSRTELSDVSDTSVFKHLLAASARSDDEIYYQMSLILDLFSIDTATGDDLDERAKDIQPADIERIQAAKATGQVVFSRNGTSGTITISTGTKVKTSDGEVFTTTTIGTITPTSPEQVIGHGAGRDSNLVSVIADVPGSAGNVVAGSVSKFVSKPPGVDEVTNLTAFLNGRDKETDAAFRTRIKNYIAGLSRNTVGAIEANLIGQQDPDTLATIITTKVVEDQTDRGNITVYVDDGTGTAESSTPVHVELTATYSWNGTTTITVTAGTTSDIAVGDFIKLGTSGIMFEVITEVPDTSLTIDNPSAETIPTGVGTSYKAGDNLTQGLAGPPSDTAVGGETLLYLENVPVKSAVGYALISSSRGVLVEGTDYQVNTATGQVDFLIALITGEKVVADYTYYTGLIAFAQKIVDGDPNDRVNYPGLRAAGVHAVVQVPQVLIQVVGCSVTVSEGFDQDEVRETVKQALITHINALNISGDVLLYRLIERVMAVSGVYNATIITPTADVIILDDQLARTTDLNVTVA